MRLILHAGTHKTGTTSIQSTLAENREWLHEKGYVFPSLGPVGHNEFAHRLAQAKLKEIESFRTAIMSVADPDRVLILSAEEFSTQLVGAKQWRFEKNEYWQQRRDYLARLRTILRDFDQVTVFLCFRRHDAFAQSLYTTTVLSDQHRWSFAEFCDRCTPLFDYRGQVETFRTAFPDVRLMSFQDVQKDLVTRFCSWLGIPLPPNRLQKPKKVSPDARLVYWLHRTGADNHETFKLMASFVRSEAAKSIIPDSPGSLWRSGEEWRCFVGHCTDPEPGFLLPYASPPPLAPLSEQELIPIDEAFSQWRSKPRKEKKWRRGAAAAPLSPSLDQ